MHNMCIQRDIECLVREHSSAHSPLPAAFATACCSFSDSSTLCSWSSSSPYSFFSLPAYIVLFSWVIHSPSSFSFLFPSCSLFFPCDILPRAAIIIVIIIIVIIIIVVVVVELITIIIVILIYWFTLQSSSSFNLPILHSPAPTLLPPLLTPICNRLPSAGRVKDKHGRGGYGQPRSSYITK